VRTGDKITITNKDLIPHSVTSGTGPQDSNSGVFFDSSIIEGGKSSNIATSNLAPGEYDFFCVIHPFMKGKLQVLSKNLTLSTQPGQVGTELIVPKSIISNVTKPPTQPPTTVQPLPQQPTTPTQQPPTTTKQTTGGLSERSSLTIKIVPGSSDPAIGKFYTPDPATIPRGANVTWDNDDDTLHTVTSGSPGATSGTEFDSGYLAAGSTFQHTFNNAGIFDYWCTLHPHMIGKVVVR
jgi:plastocyanin